jgi:phospholipid/cholesterol/gamma-HCH transport system substrate-binding protein
VLARVAALVGLVAAAVLIAALMFGGCGSTYEVTAVFDNAGQLVKGNQVQVGGRPVGTISDISLNDDGQAEVKMSVNDDALTPLPKGTTATIRATSLSGIANRYVSLKLGANGGSSIDDGGRIGADKTSAPVDLDQLFNTIDPPTRRALQQVIQGSAAWYAGKSKQTSQSTKYLSPALFTTSQLTQEIALDDRVFERFVLDTSRTVSALAERRDDLSSLIGNANTTAQAIGDENVALDQTLARLPDTLRKGNTTFVNLRSTLDDLDPLVAASKPATKRLAPFLRDLRPLVHDSRPTIRSLRELIRKPGKDNDAIELIRKQPKLARLVSTAFPRTIRALNDSIPLVSYARMYTPDLAGWFTKFGANSAANYDADGHYARIQPIFGGFAFNDNPAGGLLTPLPPGQSPISGFDTGNLKRCPGGATQPPPDRSAPVPAPSCDPSATPPGP